MEHGTVIIMGSARVDGDTACACAKLARLCAPTAKVRPLAPLELQPFNYAGGAKDGFIPLIEDILQHDNIVFATPLYWYSMSGLMKTFLDRFTDLLVNPDKRSLGRTLAGRNAWALVSGTDRLPPGGLAEPFELTAGYFNMSWRGLTYLCALREGGFPQDVDGQLAELAARLSTSKE